MEKTLDQFSIQKRNGKPASECKACSAERQREAYKNNESYREARKQWSRDKSSTQDHRKPWNRHHITEQRFLDLVNLFNGKCHVCKSEPATVVDHDHNCCAGVYSCGKCIRGVLCAGCNKALGLLRDNEQTLLTAVEYLRGGSIQVITPD